MCVIIGCLTSRARRGVDDHGLACPFDVRTRRSSLSYANFINYEKVLLLLPAVWHGGRASRIRELRAFVFCAHFLL